MIKKLTTCFLCLLFFAPFVSSGQTIPSEFDKTVVFIFIKDAKGQIVPNGTAFFISKPDSTHSINFIYLVTAKHVIQNINNGHFYDKIYIRINKRNSTFDTIPISLITLNNQQRFVTEPTIDLAVIPMAPDFSKYEYDPIPENLLFKTKMEFDTSYLGQGTDVFYCGLFSQYLGYSSNKPIMRFGRIALLPKEKILWDSSQNNQDLFLVETSTYGGNSGSPLFSYKSNSTFDGSMEVGDRQVRLAGIVKGYSGEKTPIEFVQASMNLVYTSNVGITAIIPAYLLYQIIEGNILNNTRNFIIKNLRK
jgi:hypothetical protein